MHRFNPLPPKMPTLSHHSKASKNDLTEYRPRHWSEYFETKTEVIENRTSFCVYRSGSCSECNILLIHGAGFSSLTWALSSHHLRTILDCNVIAFDLRGHGESKTEDDYNLTTETLVNDLLTVCAKLHLSKLIIIGHSLGGAIATHFTAHARKSGEINVIALVVIDVVEGSALESLNSMDIVLRNRPSYFTSIDKAVEWAYKSGHIRNLESARVSMAGQLKNGLSNEPGTIGIEADSKNDSNSKVNDTEVKSFSQRPSTATIKEGNEEDEEILSTHVPSDIKESHNYLWRIDLSRTKIYWNDWFKGLSAKFLDVQCPKLLIIAGVDRLDRELTVGQMQGKFQMQLLPNAGHAIQEDSPAEVAQSIAGFLVRHKLSVGKVEFEHRLPAC